MPGVLYAFCSAILLVESGAVASGTERQTFALALICFCSAAGAEESVSLFTKKPLHFIC